LQLLVPHQHTDCIGQGGNEGFGDPTWFIASTDALFAHEAAEREDIRSFRSAILRDELIDQDDVAGFIEHQRALEAKAGKDRHREGGPSRSREARSEEGPTGLGEGRRAHRSSAK
jgi:hypothetical protein